MGPLEQLGALGLSKFEEVKFVDACIQLPFFEPCGRIVILKPRLRFFLRHSRCLNKI